MTDRHARFAGPSTSYVVNGPHVEATNTFDAPDAVGVTERSFTTDGATVNVALEPHSLTALVLDVA
jgi:alpha-L-arabinofuranosidase